MKIFLIDFAGYGIAYYKTISIIYRRYPLLIIFLRNRTQKFFCITKRIVYIARRTGNPSFLYTGLDCNGIVDIFLNFGGEGLKFFHAKFVQGLVIFYGIGYHPADNTVRVTEWHTMLDQIIRRIRRVGKAELCLAKHLVRPQLHGCKHPGKHRKAHFNSVQRIEQLFLVLLHILIISKRKPFHYREQSRQVPEYTAGLAAHQLGHIRILLLRHDAAAGTVGIVQFNK